MSRLGQSELERQICDFERNFPDFLVFRGLPIMERRLLTNRVAVTASGIRVESTMTIIIWG
jgi:hypothetical protein